MEKIRTVLAEDESILLKELKRQLEAFDLFEFVGFCAHGIEALDTIRNTEPDVVFLDIQMPGLNGFEVLNALPKEQQPQVVFVTANEKFAAKAFEVGATDYLVKPLKLTELAQCVDKISQRYLAAKA